MTKVNKVKTLIEKYNQVYEPYKYVIDRNETLNSIITRCIGRNGYI